MVVYYFTHVDNILTYLYNKLILCVNTYQHCTNYTADIVVLFCELDVGKKNVLLTPAPSEPF